MEPAARREGRCFRDADRHADGESILGRRARRGADEGARGRRGCGPSAPLPPPAERDRAARGMRHRFARYTRERRDPWLEVDWLGGSVKRSDRAAEGIGERGIDHAPLRQAVERCVLVEAAHFERPFHRGAAAIERQPAVRLARDRKHAAVDIGRKRTIDLKLRLAGALAPGNGRIVEEGKADRTLDLQGTLTDEKHRGGMSIDALDRATVMDRGIGKEREDGVLAFTVTHARRPLAAPSSTWRWAGPAGNRVHAIEALLMLCCCPYRRPIEAVMTQLPQALKRIRLNLARSKEFPSGSDRHGRVV